MTIIKNIATNPELKHIDLGQVELNYSWHALKRSSEKNIRLKPSLVVKGNVVETESINNRTIKLVVRTTYNDTHDLVLVVLPGGFVKTVWLNHKKDTHKTLNKQRINGKKKAS